MKVTAVIPTLNPPMQILQVVDELLEAGFEQVLIVDDGSKKDCMPIFAKLEQKENCTVLHHTVNGGKGRALKTAFTYLSRNGTDCKGVVTLDDDGQHLTRDAVACAQALLASPHSLVLGVRDFNSPQVPPKSRVGNKTTAMVFQFACGLKVSDTQTGLRGIPLELFASFASLEGEGFEYETNMLLELGSLDISIVEVPIQTVYFQGNRATHFRPLLDSFKIYRRLFKFMMSSILAFFVDILLFWMLSCVLPIESTTGLVFCATAGARIFSSLVNFFINRKLVFKKQGTIAQPLARYYTLCVAQGFLSFALVSIASGIAGPKLMVLWKILVDFFLFLCSFRIQDRWVFARQAKQAKLKVAERAKPKPKALVLAGRILGVTGLILVLLTGSLLAAGAVVCYGPSPAARDLLITTVMETSAAKFVAHIYFSPEEINAILSANNTKGTQGITDTNAVQMTKPQDGEDLSEILIEDVKGRTFVGKMMIVRDPSRIFVATIPQYSEEGEGMLLTDLLETNDAVAGINGGAFLDEKGFGRGGMPRGVVIRDGKVVCDTPTPFSTVIGFDAQHRLIVGDISAAKAVEMGIQQAVSFGPALVVNGKRVTFSGTGGGLNPRTAIGQRADGAVLLLVVDGRQPHSLGATFNDLADVMVEYGAVNAGNLDGGSSSLLVHEGQVLNSLFSVTGMRPIPTAFLVKKSGGSEQ